MNMIKVFWAFIQKEVYHILRDRRTLLILFGMPIAQVLIFGFAVTNEFKNANIDILDHAKDQTSQKLIRHVTSSGHFKINRMLLAEHEMESGFKSGKTDLIMVIPADFSKDLYTWDQAEIQLIADGSDPNMANALEQYAKAMINGFLFQEFKQSAKPYLIGIETRMLYNPLLESAYNFIPGTIALILLIISAMMTSLTIAREKEQGTMEILLVSPLPPLLIILGKVAPYAILSFIDAVLILIMGYFIFDVPVTGSVILLLLLCMVYVITALSLGTLISTTSETQQDAMMKSLIGLLMPSTLLSGFIFPLTSMPEILQYIGHIIPATYFIEILKGVMLRGVGIEYILFEVGMLLFMIVAFLTLTWKKFKIRLE
ncbi:ABC transporter permease [Fulvivirga sp. 29W222]|uniref:ABC transporter permease n=1 Tax=Fulvivirga marina TaxID=2494733 RepID=A0A937FYB8_9BACT|nr:ABC transporter permease [Fulvivirga marina]MBL6448274.1 ABC transporter permease [Fulvivirga marina]